MTRSQTRSPRPNRANWELAYGETLRVIAATVGDTPDFRAERRALVLRARALRTGSPDPAPSIAREMQRHD